MNRLLLVVSAGVMTGSCARRSTVAEQELNRGRALIRTNGDMVIAAHVLSDVCCREVSDSGELTPQAPLACAELSNVVRKAWESSAMLEATLRCPRAVPAEVIVEALNRRREMPLLPEASLWLIEALDRRPPTPDIANGVVLALDYPALPNGGVWPLGDYDRVARRAGRYLSELGEDDLVPVVEALDNTSAFVRGNAVAALERSVESAALELPIAESRLHDLLEDPDPEVAKQARWALSTFAKRRSESVETQLAQVLQRPIAARRNLLSRRRQFCGVAAADAALAHLRSSAADENARALVDAAIEYRRRRCAGAP